MNLGKSLVVACVLGTSAWSASVSLDPISTHQAVEGFGGGVVYYQNWFTAQDAAVKTAIYDTAFTGLGISIMRVGNWLQNDSTGAGIDRDLEIYQALKTRRPGAKVFMTSWSAPDSIKVSGSVNGNGHNENSSSESLPEAQNTLEKNGGVFKYAEFAQWWRQTYQAYVAKGITPDYISIQNEPDFNAKYASTILKPTETSDVAGYDKAFKAVRDTFTQAGLTNVKLVGPEPIGVGSNKVEGYADAMKALTLSPGAFAFHLYDNGDGNSSDDYANPESFRTVLASVASNLQSFNKPIIMSEYCHMGQSKPSSYDMVSLAHLIQVGFTSGNLSGYINWELLWGDSTAKNGQMISVSKPTSWVTDPSGIKGKFTVNPEYHAMRHYSRFINPNWLRIDAAVDNADLKPVAFKSADGDSLTLVVTNPSATQEIPLTGYSGNGFYVSNMIQSVTGGNMSKVLSNATCLMLPPRSITTIVLKSGSETLTPATCGAGGTVIPAYAATPVGTTIYDASVSGITGWTATNAKVTVASATTAAGKTVAKVTFANQKQETEGYVNVEYSLSGASANLSTCKVVSVNAFNTSASAVSINMGVGANGSYAATASVPASSTDWVTVNFPLNGKTLSGKLTFNSDGLGPVYIANIMGLGCGSSNVVIHDFTTGDLGTWTPAAGVNAASISSITVDGLSKFLFLPLAGCDQSTCGYKNIFFTNDVLGQGILGKCEVMGITAHTDASTSSLNIGASGSGWIDYGYGYSVATADAWKELIIPLTKEEGNNSTKLKFNSNSTGIYISKITGYACTGVSSTILPPLKPMQWEGRYVKVFDFAGRQVWQGTLEQGMLEGTSLQLNGLQKGMYFLQTSGASLRAFVR